MASEFSIQPFRSQEEAQAYREGVGALPAQAAWMAGLMAPSSGISDFLGLYPEMPTEEQMIPTEQMPSFGENIANKQYLDAILQSAGVLGDAAYASIPFTGPGGAIAGTALKGIGAVGKASKGAKVKGLSSLPESEDYITAYHGTAADFDKFDIGKIGTGEGMQAYGRGLYFAEEELVGKEYQKALGTVVKYDGKTIMEGDKQVGTTGDQDIDDLIMMEYGDMDKAIINAERQFENSSDILNQSKKEGLYEDYSADEELTEWWGTQLKKLREIDTKNLVEVEDTGKLYEAKLKVTPDELLDLNKPLNKQNKAVKEKLTSVLDKEVSSLNPEGVISVDEGVTLREMIDARLQRSFSDNTVGRMEGYSFMKTMNQILSPERTSEVLDAVGIKGNKYKDAFSRDAKGGTSNYVIFDDRVIDISKKYAVAIPVAGAILLAHDEEMAAAQNDSLDL
jgi:hypothetical protein